MKRRIWVNASGLTRLVLERPEPSLREIWLESTRTESIKKRRSAWRPSGHEPPVPNCLPSCFSNISANQF
jgi:hypothetical protein